MRIYCDSSTREACIVVEGQNPVVIPYDALVTNNVGEYKAVIIALTIAKRQRVVQFKRKISICTDSQLVVNQVKSKEDGGWKCRARHLLPYITQVRELARKLDCEIKWVPREENLAGRVLG